MSRRKKLRNSIFILLKVSVSAFFIGLLLWIMRGNKDEIVNTIKTTKVWLFTVSFFLYFLIVLVVSYRFKRVLDVQGIHLSLREVTRLSLIGFFFSNFLPSAVGGDIVKAYYTSKRTNKFIESALSVFMDRLFGLVSFVLIAGAALIFIGRQIENKAIIWVVAGMIAISIAILFLLLNKPMVKKLGFLLTVFRLPQLELRIRNLYRLADKYRHNKKILLQTFYASLASQVLSIFAIYLLAESLSAHIPIGMLFLVIPIISTLSLFPSLNGLGIREGAYVYFFGGVIGPEKAFAVAFLWLVLFWGLSLMGGIAHLMRR